MQPVTQKDIDDLINIDVNNKNEIWSLAFIGLAAELDAIDLVAGPDHAAATAPKQVVHEYIKFVQTTERMERWSRAAELTLARVGRLSSLALQGLRSLPGPQPTPSPPSGRTGQASASAADAAKATAAFNAKLNKETLVALRLTSATVYALLYVKLVIAEVASDHYSAARHRDLGKCGEERGRIHDLNREINRLRTARLLFMGL